MKFLPGWRATICAGVNVSMTGGTMINVLSYYGMRFGTMKQSCAWELQYPKEESKTLIKSNPMILTSYEFFFSGLCNPMGLDTNQMNGVSVKKKGGYSCTVSQDGHCFNVLTSLKMSWSLVSWDIHSCWKTKCSNIGRMEKGREWYWSTAWLTLLYFWGKWSRRVSNLLWDGLCTC